MANNSPVDRIQIGGVTASIFKNTGSNGTFHTASIERTYKKDGEFETTNSYGIKGLAALTAVSIQATAKCLELDGAGEADDELEEAA